MKLVQESRVISEKGSTFKVICVSLNDEGRRLVSVRQAIKSGQAKSGSQKSAVGKR